MLRYLLAWLVSSSALALLHAQQALDITIGLDRLSDSTEYFVPGILEEIEALLHTEYDLSFELIGLDQPNFEGALNFAYESSDLVIVTGLEVSQYLSERTIFPKPTILSLVLDNEIQNLPITEAGTCGVPNLTYVQSFFNIERDLATLYEIIPYEELIVLVDGSASSTNAFDMEAFLRKRSPNENVSFSIVPINDPATALTTVPNTSPAVFTFPLDRVLNLEQQKKLYENLKIVRKLTTMCFLRPAASQNPSIRIFPVQTRNTPAPCSIPACRTHQSLRPENTVSS